MASRRSGSSSTKLRHAIADDIAILAASFRSIEKTGVLEGESARSASEFSWNFAK